MNGLRRHQPQRSCVACRRTAAQEELLRYVLAPEGQLLVDYRHKLPGRGAYTCISRECMVTAVEKHQFQRSFRGRRVSADVDRLVLDLQNQLLKRVEGLLGMARKSGQLESGSNTLLDGLRKSVDYAVLILAEDISAGIGDKLSALADRKGIPVFRLLNKGRLGQRLGKSERSAVAVHAGTLADAILLELQRIVEMAREN